MNEQRYIRCSERSRNTLDKCGKRTWNQDITAPNILASSSKQLLQLATKFYMQNFEAMALVLGCIGTLCWIVCFWWMHRISSRQDAMLEEVHEMTARIEKLSQSEHDLISDVHPQVSEIKEQVENVREVVSSERS
jgi:hypothetical protein